MLSDTSAEARAELAQRELRLLRLAFGFLITTALTITLARLSDGELLVDSAAHWLALPAWLAAAWLLRRALNRANPGRDPLLLPLVLLLCGWGLLVVWRLAPDLGARQTAWFLVGTLAVIELLRTPRDLHWLRRYRYLWLIGGLALTALTLVFGTNPAGGEPRLWLGCCGLYLQPSEPLRLLLIVYVAAYLSDKMLVQQPINWARDLLPLVLAAGIAGLLLLAQRDLGTAVLFLTVLAAMLYFAFGHLTVPIAAAALVVAGGALGYLALDLVQTRVAAWLDPWSDPTGAGYQIVQSVIAIASGGVFGAGPGMGAPNAVPVVQSDFVFSAVAEEWGLIGAVAMLTLFALLVGRGLRLAARAREPFVVLLAGGISVALGLQVLLIVAGVTRLLPITGVTLPLISYGGSSLVTNLIGLGLLLKLSRQRPRASGRFAAPLLRTQTALGLGWVACALAVGWWSVVRVEALTSRTDNPRRALDSRDSRRGQILDRSGEVLATTVGQPGAFERRYLVPVAVPITGYDSPLYGQSGIERSMDAVLRGETGPDPLRIWWHKLLYGVPPEGADLRLTIDAGLQRAAAELLDGRPGAVVVIDPASGEVLALASAPSYDPNVLAEQWTELLQRQDAPLLNRATQGYYQPGLALAPLLFGWAVSEGELDPRAAPPDLMRTIELFGREFGCQQPVPPETAPDWSAALQYACAGPFGALGEQLGTDRLQAAIAAYGLDQQAQIRLEQGAVPERQLLAEFVELQQAGTAIGQGALVVSPLQLARAYAALAAAGVRPALSVVQAIQPGQGAVEPLELEQSVLRPTAAQVTLDALRSYTPDGVGYEATAVSGAGSASWFIGLQPAQRVVVVVLEDASVVSAREVGLALLRAP